MVTFYELDENGNPKAPVLFLDTLKVSTIEQTAETAEARGGKGNAPLIIWDYGKEINVTLEDALFSPKSMSIMFGNGKVSTIGSSTTIMKTEQFYKKDSSTTFSDQYEGPDGKIYTKKNMKYFKEDGTYVETASEVGNYLVSYDLDITGSGIEISSSSFPGTYYVTGDTYCRSEASGKDELFQFIIPKAKVLSENTITLEAEGDPSVFNMSLRVLRPSDGKMMKLVKYNLSGSSKDQTAGSFTIANTSNLSGAAAG